MKWLLLEFYVFSHYVMGNHKQLSNITLWPQEPIKVNVQPHVYLYRLLG